MMVLLTFLLSTTFHQGDFLLGPLNVYLFMLLFFI